MIVDEWGAGFFAITSCGRFVLRTEGKSDFNTHKRAGQLSLPMGHLRPGEGLLTCALREFGEETNHSLSLDMHSIRPAGRVLLGKADGQYAAIAMFAGRILGPANNGATSPVIYASSDEILAMDDRLVRPPTKAAIKHLLEQNSRLHPWPAFFVFEDLVVG